MPERRNSTISNSSSQLKVRTRCDSYSGMSSCTAQSNGNLSPSTMAGGSYYMPQHLHYTNHNHLAEKVVYVTNAVAAAAAEAKNSANASSPKYGRLRNPLTVDTSDKYHYPSAGSAGTISYQQRQSQPPPLSYQHQTMHGHSPYLNKLNFTRNNFTSKSSPSIGHTSDDNGDANDDDDDIAGQYATLLTLTQQPSVHNEYSYPITNNNNNNSTMAADGADSPEPETHYSVIKKLSSAPPPSESATANADTYDHLPKHQGLGGYWTTSENNERIWCSIDNRLVCDSVNDRFAGCSLHFCFSLSTATPVWIERVKKIKSKRRLDATQINRSNRRRWGISISLINRTKFWMPYQSRRL